jgi:hypothetical protein
MCLVVCALIESARTDGLLMAVSVHDPFSTTRRENKFATKQSDPDCSLENRSKNRTHLPIGSLRIAGTSYVLRSIGSIPGTLPVGSATEALPRTPPNGDER